MEPDARTDADDESAGDPRHARAAGSLEGVPADPSRPWTWSAPLLALGRTPVRMHASFMALALLQALRVIRPGPSGPLPDTMAQMLVVIVTLAWLALLADAVREGASRLGGAVPGTIVIWPAGGLNWRDPAGPWSSRLAVALAAPAASICVSVGLGTALLLHADQWNVALPSPWSMDGFDAVDGDRLWSTVWLVQWANVAMLAASAIPAHPFAGGRIVESVLEPWLGRAGALRAALVLGITAGIVIAIVGLAFGSLLTVACGAIAVGVGMSGARTLGLRAGLAGLGLWTMIAADASAANRARAKVRAERQAREDDAALDGILAKVAKDGIDSLTREERRVLARSTARRRGNADGSRGSEPREGGRHGTEGPRAGDSGDSAAA
jgi:hypothetical protein